MHVIHGNFLICLIQVILNKTLREIEFLTFTSTPNTRVKFYKQITYY